ncbi:HIRAN domain-containing protein [Megalodesulfovibrio gigas]|nr:HIRAN domain-containing protein [Megalodesulfovibrio gigas]
MADIAVAFSGLSGQLMGATAGTVEIAIPFTAEIFLIDTHIAGLAYYAAAEALTVEGEPPALTLRREPGNPYDALAIEVLTADGKKLGYVPRKINPILARLMDAGKMLGAVVTRVHQGAHGTVGEVAIHIFLKEA